MGESEYKLFWRCAGVILFACLSWLAISISKQNICIAKLFPQPMSQQNACINNLRQIDAAINEWALEKQKTNGTVVIEDEIKPYIKLDANGNLPKCPSGGKYTLGKVGDKSQVTCSLSTANPPHKLP